MTVLAAESYSFLDFFAGSGLVTEGVKPWFHTVWANDISEEKAAVYLANQDRSAFHLGPLQDFSGATLPEAIVSWASFPCQDLSVAGKQRGIHGNRSGLVWTWLKVMDEMSQRPPIVVAENVSGLTSTEKGVNYRALHEALVSRGYRVGPLLLDALRWVPQSRKRVFVVGVDSRIDLTGLAAYGPNWLHPATVVSASRVLKDVVWWKLPKPTVTHKRLSDLIEPGAPFDHGLRARHTIELIPPEHLHKLKDALSKGLKVFPGYRRIRHGKQVLEIRTDDVSGCLRTANGGSSREFLVIDVDGRLESRLLTIREAARLMGVPDSYKIPGSYNSGYSAMGDAVAMPVTRFLAEHLLLPLARRADGFDWTTTQGLQTSKPSYGQGFLIRDARNHARGKRKRIATKS